tara:strand:+ start:664 stop:858 length:195 start_codon:yes stop_codon:yes gene_type:complete
MLFSILALIAAWKNGAGAEMLIAVNVIEINEASDASSLASKIIGALMFATLGTGLLYLSEKKRK